MIRFQLPKIKYCWYSLRFGYLEEESSKQYVLQILQGIYYKMIDQWSTQAILYHFNYSRDILSQKTIFTWSSVLKKCLLLCNKLPICKCYLNNLKIYLNFDESNRLLFNYLGVDRPDMAVNVQQEYVVLGRNLVQIMFVEQSLLFQLKVVVSHSEYLGAGGGFVLGNIVPNVADDVADTLHFAERGSSEVKSLSQDDCAQREVGVCIIECRHERFSMKIDYLSV